MPTHVLTDEKTGDTLKKRELVAKTKLISVVLRLLLLFIGSSGSSSNTTVY
jgi:hypothetical protein